MSELAHQRLLQSGLVETNAHRVDDAMDQLLHALGRMDLEQRRRFRETPLGQKVIEAANEDAVHYDDTYQIID